MCIFIFHAFFLSSDFMVPIPVTRAGVVKNRWNCKSGKLIVSHVGRITCRPSCVGIVVYLLGVELTIAHGGRIIYFHWRSVLLLRPGGLVSYRSLWVGLTFTLPRTHLHVVGILRFMYLPEEVGAKIWTFPFF